MDHNDRRHFPLTFRVYRMCRIVTDHFFAVGNPSDLIYGGDAFAHRVMDDLIAELGESDQYDTDGGRRYGALFFAADAMKAYHPDPHEIGFFMPKW